MVEALQCTRYCVSISNLTKLEFNMGFISINETRSMCQTSSHIYTHFYWIRDKQSRSIREAFEMNVCVMNTVHQLLDHSGQATPAKHLSRDERSLEVYDIEHWPETFNSLLMHDFPSLCISVDSSVASLSGFVVTLTWTPSVDASQRIEVLVYISALTVLLCLVLRTCFMGIARVSLEQFAETQGGSSLLADQLHSLVTKGEL